MEEEGPRDEQGLDRTDAGPLPDDEPLAHFQALDAIAAERDMVLGFRVCEESQEFEPVFMRIMRANGGEEHETALISIGDERGLPLGRYVVSRRRLEAALNEATDVSEDEPEPSVVPGEWLDEPATPSYGLSPLATDEPPESFDLPVPGASTRLPAGDQPAPRRHRFRRALGRGLRAMRHADGV
jgi:hypothetical protein